MRCRTRFPTIIQTPVKLESRLRQVAVEIIRDDRDIIEASVTIATRKAIIGALDIARQFLKTHLGLPAKYYKVVIPSITHGEDPPIEDNSLQLAVACATVGAAIGVDGEPSVVMTGQVSTKDSRIVVESVGGLDRKKQACAEKPEVMLLLCPGTEDSLPSFEYKKSIVVVRPIRHFEDAVVLGLNCLYPFRLVSYNDKTDFKRVLSVFQSWSLRRMRGGLYPFGLGEVVQALAEESAFWRTFFKSPFWIHLATRFAPSAGSQYIEDLLAAIFVGDRPSPFNIHEAEKKILNVIGPLLADIRPTLSQPVSDHDENNCVYAAQLIEAVHALLRALDIAMPGLLSQLFSDHSRTLYQYLIGMTRSILAPLYERLRNLSQDERKEFVKKHPELTRVQELFIYLQQHGDLPGIALEMLGSLKYPQLRIVVSWENTLDGCYSPSEFQLDLLGPPTGDEQGKSISGTVDWPVALIEDDAFCPLALQRPRQSGEPRWVYDFTSSPKEVLDAFGETVLIRTKRTEILWRDMRGVWPPSIDSFHVVRYLLSSRRLKGVHRIIDVGAGTGIIGIFCAMHYPDDISEVVFVEENPAAAVVCAINVLLNLSDMDLSDLESKNSLEVACDRILALFNSPDGLEIKRERGVPLRVRVGIYRGNAMAYFRQYKFQEAKNTAIICTPPYLPEAHTLDPGMWRAVAGTELLEFMIRYSHKFAQRLIIQFSSIAYSYANRAFIEAQRSGELSARFKEMESIPTTHLGTVAFKIPPLYSFFVTDADYEDRVDALEVEIPAEIKEFMETLEGIKEWRDVDAMFNQRRRDKPPGFRFYHDLLISDLTFG